MKKEKIRNSSLLLLAFAFTGAIVLWILTLLVDFTNDDQQAQISYSTTSEVATDELVFDPPRPEDAPEKIREAVMLGYNIINNTQEYASEYVGNDLNCTNCHFDAGRAKHTLSLVGVAAKYPKFRSRQEFSADLVTRTNGCFQRSQNGKPLPHDSKKMAAIMTYYHWISKDIPIYADIPWLGLKLIKSDHEPRVDTGRTVFTKNCRMCHGTNGQGTRIAPPLWGSGSYNNGAGMAEVPKLAAFTHLYMPKGNPRLSKTEALDVAAFVNSRPRPDLKKQ